jgi:hypothetical protein
MPSADDIKRLVGKRVTMRLSPAAGGPQAITGRLVGALDAADGLVVTLQPADQPGHRATYHYHHILEIETEEE